MSEDEKPAKKSKPQSPFDMTPAPAPEAPAEWGDLPDVNAPAADVPPADVWGDAPEPKAEAPAAPPELEHEPEHEPEEQRTIFSPSPLASTPPKSAPEPKPESKPAPEPKAEPQVTAPPQQPQQTGFGTSFTPMTPRGDGGGIQIGDVLNHMFEVKRFIARGGMGEVFEGMNVQSEERVAIKVMLPALAADPNVQAMFRKEAKTLTKLAHPALVQYRVIAQEPQLGVLYIVTEYVDSKNLEDALPSLKASPAELIALTRRLADGLRVAHSLGAIHRDISPDNILLEDGELAKARIIDFGIAKDLDPKSKTIIGDGFAGKLNFVAPEQLGDFNREVGPWTDVYSLALVILSVAQSKGVNMGGSLVDAVDKRRQGPDLSTAPAEIRPLLTAMLTPNPVDRLRSMDEVIAFIDGKLTSGAAPAPARTAPKAAAKPVPAPKVEKPKPVATTGGATPPSGLDPKLLMIGGGAAAGLLVLIIAGVLLFGGKKDTKSETGTVATAENPVESARQAINAVLPSAECAWLDIADLGGDASGINVSVKGVALNTVAVQKVISDAMTARGLKLNQLTTDDVAPLAQQNACPLLNEYASIKSKDTTSLSSPQVKWEMAVPADAPGSPPIAKPIVYFTADAATPDLAIYGLQTSGEGINLIPNKSQLPAQGTTGGSIINLGNGRYEMDLAQNETGWAGILVVRGKGPFDDHIILPPATGRGANWQAAFHDKAAANGWHTEMIWINTVDDIAN